MKRVLGPLLLTTAALAAAAQPEEVPKAVGLEERVYVTRTQVEVIVHPPKDDAGICERLTKRDFEVRVARRPFSDFDVDPISIPVAGAGAAPGTEAAFERPRRWIALLFDWQAIEGTDPGPNDPRGRAFDQARATIAGHPDDRFVILDVADDARFHSTAFEEAPEALETLARFEEAANGTGFMMHGEHLTYRWWREAMLDAVYRLGALEPNETKDLFVLTTDVPVGLEYYTFQDDLRKATSQSHVRLHSVDLAWDENVLPYGLFAFSEAGGGMTFSDGNTVSSAIETLDELRPCTFRLTLNLPESKKALAFHVEMKDPKIKVTAPEAVGGAIDREATETAVLENDWAVPSSSIGLLITPKLVELARTERSVTYALTFVVEKAGEFDPSDVGALRVYGAVWSGEGSRRKVHADYSGFEITEDALRTILKEGKKEFRFGVPAKVPAKRRPLAIVSVHGSPEALTRLSASARTDGGAN